MSEPNWKRVKNDSGLRERLLTRSRILAGIRQFFTDQAFLEVYTPLLVSHPGMEPNLEPFRTVLKDASGEEQVAYLITSPEYSLKKLLAGGFGPLFQISSCFRNGEPWSSQSGSEGTRHNPEFAMIEWYRPEADYTELMKDTEDMVSKISESIFGLKQVEWQGHEIDLTTPWIRISVAEAFEKYAGIDLLGGIDNPNNFRKTAQSKGIEISESDSFDDIFFKIFLRDIEPKLGIPTEENGIARPVILYDYPKSMASLARIKPEDDRLAERFEVYCCGLELANAFSELTDSKEQRRRLEEEQVERNRLKKPVFPIDEQFLEAVDMMPKAAGIAFGIDRLVMLLTDSRNIRDVLFFPSEDMFL